MAGKLPCSLVCVFLLTAICAIVTEPKFHIQIGDRDYNTNVGYALATKDGGILLSGKNGILFAG